MIKPNEFIKNMGAGYNLGNMYECYNFTKSTEYWRYWQYGTWKYSLSSYNTDIIKSTSFTMIKSAETKSIVLSFNIIKELKDFDFKITHSSYKTGNGKIIFNIEKVSLDNEIIKPNIKEFVMSELNNGEASFKFTLNDILGEEQNTDGRKLSVTIAANRDSLTQYPTLDDNILSTVRSYYCTSPIDSWGNRRLKEAHLLAIWAVGFRSIRLPVTWSGHCDVLENGHVTIDKEFFEHLDNILQTIHTDEHPFNICINVHHDDGASGWLRTDKYLTDKTVVNRYKDYWNQISEHFKDYDYWLQFGTNNEVLNSSSVWEGSGVTTTDIFGLVTFQKDAYDIIRNSGGNNKNRIVFYPTYAAKRGSMGASYINPNDPSDKGLWHIPYDDNGNIDAYGICDIHPYNSNITSIQNDNKKVRAYNYPVVYGEYGVNASQLTSKAVCVSQCYLVAYATWAGIGTYLWDDFGTMKTLNKDSCSLTNSYDFDKLWQGFTYNYIPSLCQSANLKQVDIGLTNRRSILCMGDTSTILLDTKDVVTVTQEEGDTVVLSGDTITTGNYGKSTLLAISYTGEYNTITIDVKPYKNKIATVYDKNWEHYSYSVWDSWKVTDNPNNASFFIPVHGGDEIAFTNTTNTNALYVREYSASKSLLTWGDKAYSIASGQSKAVQSNCAFVGVYFIRNRISSGVYQEVKEGTNVTVYSRDYNMNEEGFETEERTANISDLNQYSVSINRIVNIIGGVEYLFDMGIDCKVHVIEYGKDKESIKNDTWYKNGDRFTTNLFSFYMRLDIVIDNITYKSIIEKFENKELEPKLLYHDFCDADNTIYNESYSKDQEIEQGSIIDHEYWKDSITHKIYKASCQNGEMVLIKVE